MVQQRTKKSPVKKTSTGKAGKVTKSKTAAAPKKVTKSAEAPVSKAAAAKAKAKAAKAKAQEDADVDEAAAGMGHNGGPTSDISSAQLRKFISSIERMEEEKAACAEDIKELYAGAKAVGFDTKIMRKVIARRKRDAAQVQEEEALIDVYESALGDLK